MATNQTVRNPSWWTLEHETGWAKMKRSLAEGWEKVKDATGASEKSHFEEAEPALRFGYGARKHYGTEWTEAAPELEKEWGGLGTGREWQKAQGHIRQGWDSHTRHATAEPRAQTSVREGASGFGASGAGDSGSGFGDD